MRRFFEVAWNIVQLPVATIVLIFYWPIMPAWWGTVAGSWLLAKGIERFFAPTNPILGGVVNPFIWFLGAFVLTMLMWGLVVLGIGLGERAEEALLD